MRGLFLALLILLASAAHAKEPVGIRANNPGNVHGIRGQVWEGSKGVDGYGYVRFQDAFYGLRALKHVLQSYFLRHHIRTVAGIRNRWVRRPKYPEQVQRLRRDILLVSRLLHVQPNQTLTWSEDTEIKLAKAIVFAENSEQPYPDSLYRAAFEN